jgi:mono/diheme cytochrome c family protein
MPMRSLVASALFAGAMIPAAAFAASDSAALYQVRCGSCHGTEGQGTKAVMPALGPALKGNPFIVNGSPAAIRNVIRKGRSGQKRLYNDTFPNMPQFGPEMVDDVDSLVAYLKGPLQK